MTEHTLEPPRDSEFHKSSYSNDHQGCVEVAPTPTGGAWVRDTKDRSKPAHYFTPVEWDAFVRGVKDGEFG